jgi:hypothetical protein
MVYANHLTQAVFGPACAQGGIDTESDVPESGGFGAAHLSGPNIGRPWKSCTNILNSAGHRLRYGV